MKTNHALQLTAKELAGGRKKRRVLLWDHCDLDKYGTVVLSHDHENLNFIIPLDSTVKQLLLKLSQYLPMNPNLTLSLTEIKVWSDKVFQHGKRKVRVKLICEGIFDEDFRR